MARAKKIFKEFGIETQSFPTEEELQKRSPHYKRFIESYSKSGHVKTEKVKEFILQSLLYIDAKGKIPRMLTEKLRD